MNGPDARQKCRIQYCYWPWDLELPAVPATATARWQICHRAGCQPPRVCGAAYSTYHINLPLACRSRDYRDPAVVRCSFQRAWHLISKICNAQEVN